MNNKISNKHKIMVIVGALGVMLSVITYISNMENSYIKEGFLIRNDQGGGDYSVSLRARSNELISSMTIDVKEREYTKDELNRMSKEALTRLNEGFIKYEAKTKDIETKFELANRIEGFPFSIRWNVDSDYLDQSGKVLCKYDCDEVHEIELNVTLSYKDFNEKSVIPVKLSHKKLNELEKYIGSLNEKMDENLIESKTDQKIELPKKINGKDVIWEEEEDYTYLLVFIGGLVASILIGIAYEYDEKKKEKEKETLLQRCYPDFVEKLKLFIVSGLTLKKSIEKIYESMSKNATKDKELLVEALGKMMNQYQNGVREEVIIENFGTYCRGSYKKLSYLLIVNLKQGNEKIISLLNEEVQRALVIKKENAKKLSDAAGIKILFPMMIMLLVVMALIMIPAYLNFDR